MHLLLQVWRYTCKWQISRNLRLDCCTHHFPPFFYQKVKAVVFMKFLSSLGADSIVKHNFFFEITLLKWIPGPIFLCQAQFFIVTVSLVRVLGTNLWEELLPLSSNRRGTNRLKLTSEAGQDTVLSPMQEPYLMHYLILQHCTAASRTITISSRAMNYKHSLWNERIQTVFLEVQRE